MRALTEVERQTLRSDGRDPASLAELRDTSRVVLLALEQLPEKQQEVVRLKYQNELSYREISQVTGLSVSNVGFILHAALKSIREKLKEESPGGSPQIRRIK
jgi:RNA polymerase sigma-70 factor (ECF subfamily)